MTRKAHQTVYAALVVAFSVSAAQAADTWVPTKAASEPSGHGAVISWPCPGYPMPGQTASS